MDRKQLVRLLDDGITEVVLHANRENEKRYAQSIKVRLFKDVGEEYIFYFIDGDQQGQIKFLPIEDLVSVDYKKVITMTIKDDVASGP